MAYRYTYPPKAKVYRPPKPQEPDLKPEVGMYYKYKHNTLQFRVTEIIKGERGKYLCKVDCVLYHKEPAGWMNIILWRASTMEPVAVEESL